MTRLRKGMRRADYEQAVEAAQRWIAEHGRYPQQQEWEHRAPGRHQPPPPRCGELRLRPAVGDQLPGDRWAYRISTGPLW